MPLKLDSIQNSRYEESKDGFRIVRAGTVDQLPASAGPFDPTRLSAALNAAGMPVVGEAHPVSPSAVVVRRLVFPTEAADTVRVEVHYESPTGTAQNLPNNQFRIIRETTVMTSEFTEMDWNFNPIQAVYVDQNGENFMARNVKMQRMTPIKTAVASGLVNGVPSLDMERAIGCTNRSPFLNGLPPGYWLCTGVDVLPPTIGSLYLVTATFLSKLHVDWAGYGVIEHDRLGTPTNIKADDARYLRGQPYDAAAPPNTSRNGLVKAHLYRGADLTTIFPFVTIAR